LKAVVVSDTHLGLNRASDLYHDITLTLFKSIVDTCLRNNIRNIIHLGDWFHNRIHINIKTLDASMKIADMLTDFNVYIIAGNHDTFYKDRINPTSLDIYEEYNNIQIIKEPTVLDDITLLPWSTKYTQDTFDNIDTDYLFGHLEVNNFMMNSYYKFSGGIPISMFKKFKQVKLGHFHVPSTIDNIQYIGSPFHMNFGDHGARGYYIFDDGKFDFIEFTLAPKYIKIMSEDIIDERVIRGNIIRVMFTKDYGKTDNKKILDAIEECGPLQISSDFSGVTDDIDDIKNNITVEKPKEYIELMIDYVDKIPFDAITHIKKDTLKKIILSMSKELI